MDVLLIEDDIATRKMLDLFLTKSGNTSKSYATPRACPVLCGETHQCTADKPCADAMISDFHLPEMTGLDIFLIQRQKGCKLPDKAKLIISAGVSKDQKKAIETEGYEYLAKPFRLVDISDFLANSGQKDH